LATVTNNLLNGLNTTLTNSNVSSENLFFLGLKGALNKINLVLVNFNSSIDKIDETFKDTDWLEQDQNSIENKIKNIYENNKDKTVITSDARPAYNTQTYVPIMIKVKSHI
jgi:hypothetical protein